MKELKVLLLFIFVAVVGIGAGVKGVHFLKPPADKQQQVLNATDVAHPTKAQAKTITAPKVVEYPYSLSIPKINVTAHVESVGMDAKGAMGVPNVAENVAWYNLGYKIGEKGSAVMAGHYDKVDGSAAVFWNLTKLKTDDKIMVKDVNGKDYTYKVVRIETYPYESFPIKEVFGPSDKAMLNLITCEGKFDKKSSNYSHRTVVFSELLE